MRDFDRKLDERGIAEAAGMGRLMAERQLVPDIVICSTAARAVETLDAINETLHLESASRYEQNLYATDAPGYLEIAAATGIDFRSRNIEELDNLKADSLDFYARIRSLYRQHRENEIRNGASTDDSPNFSAVPGQNTSALE